jgi:SagB-type dehydrogenase family enzyme
MATYPLRVYLVAGNVEDLPPGVYRYIPKGHKLESVVAGDQRANVGSQPQMRTAPALLAFAADCTATAKRFGDNTARQLACLEIGHAAQNVLLEEIAQGLVGVGMTGFDGAKAKAALTLPENEELIYIVAAGKQG